MMSWVGSGRDSESSKVAELEEEGGGEGVGEGRTTWHTRRRQ